MDFSTENPPSILRSIVNKGGGFKTIPRDQLRGDNSGVSPNYAQLYYNRPAGAVTKSWPVCHSMDPLCPTYSLSLSRFVMLPRDPVRWLRLTARIQRSVMLGATTGSHSSRGEKLGHGPGSWSGSSLPNLTSGKNPLYGKWICGPGSV